MPATTEELKRTLSYLLTVKKSFLHKLQLQYLSDGDKKGISAFKILRSLIRGCKFEQVKPVLATFIKRHGFAEPRVGKILVHYLCMKNNVSGALSVIRKLKENNLSVTFPVDVLVLFMNQGRILDAYDLVLGAQDNLHVLDVVDYSIVIDGLCKEGYIDRALILSELARKKGVELNVVIYNAVLHGLCRQRCLIEAFRLFDSMERNEVVPSDFTYGTLIDALVREGFLLDARQLFERMIVKGMEPNTHIYNSLISGCCQFNNLEEALNLFDELGMRSLKPDEFTISSLIDGFCRMGDLEGALQFFVNVKTEGIVPDFLGFVYLVRGLCAKGRMEEARNILREMLQSRSSVEMINKVDVQIETDSVESFLLQLCERGSIQDALVILNEIASMFFPYKRERASSEPRQFPSLEDDMACASSKPLSFVHQLDSQDSEKVEEGEDNCCDLRFGCHQSSFNAFYSRVASLCATGDVQGASKLTREIILSCG